MNITGQRNNLMSYSSTLILLLQVLLSEVMSSLRQSSFRSFLILSSHLSKGLPLLLTPSIDIDSTLLSGAVWSLLLTCPNHRKRPSLNLLMMVPTSSLVLKTPVRLLSSMVLPHVHLSILISATSIRYAWAFVIGQLLPLYRVYLLA